MSKISKEIKRLEGEYKHWGREYVTTTCKEVKIVSLHFMEQCINSLRKVNPSYNLKRLKKLTPIEIRRKNLIDLERK